MTKFRPERSFSVYAVLAVAILTLSCSKLNLTASKRTLIDGQTISIGSSQQTVKILRIEERTTLKVEVIESFGDNIEFKVLRNGAHVYSSGVHKGTASGLVTVDSGSISIVVVNENLLKGKHVQLTVNAFSPAEYEDGGTAR
ncbi:MAG: hypothetical protein HY286_15400 [Planctomycetes bacterium]|nr:hypothetical protein [Planctomycetota bacterium]